MARKKKTREPIFSDPIEEIEEVETVSQQNNDTVVSKGWVKVTFEEMIELQETGQLVGYIPIKELALKK